jgi:hypothetical protein
MSFISKAITAIEDLEAGSDYYFVGPIKISCLGQEIGHIEDVDGIYLFVPGEDNNE